MNILKKFMFAMLLITSLSGYVMATYSVNLMWVNRDLNNEQRYIHPAKDEETLRKNFLNHIFEWAKASQGGVVNLWFDSAMIPAEAIRSTQILIDDYVRDNQGMAPIALRDVRTIPKVVEHSEIFGVKVPVYFRVDLLRAIIAVHILTSGETNCFVYGDLDMKPLSQEQLFDDETRQNLKKYGIVMACGFCLGVMVGSSFSSRIENGFMMISNDNANLLEAFKWVVIEPNIRRAYNALQGQFFPWEQGFHGLREEPGPMKALQESVYLSYPTMFEYFYSLEGYGKFKIFVKRDDGHNRVFRDYDKDKDGLHSFGLKRVITPKSILIRFVPNADQEAFLFEDTGLGDLGLKMPTKRVALPSSKIGSYEDPLFDSTSQNYTPYSSTDPISVTDSSTW